MPLISDKTLDLFLELCKKYNLPSDPAQEGFSWSLLNIMSERLDGEGFRTELEHLDDPFPLGDLSRLLIQIKLGDSLTVDNGITGPKLYTNFLIRNCIEEALTKKLKEKVFRYGKTIVIHKGGGPDGGYMITSDHPGNGDKFSLDDLNLIMGMEDDLSRRSKALRGKKAKNSDSSTHTHDLREIIGRNDEGTGLIGHVNKLPFSGTVEKYCFLYDYMSICGFLDFMDEKIKENIETEKNKGKYNYIASLLI